MLLPASEVPPPAMLVLLMPKAVESTALLAPLRSTETWALLAVLPPPMYTTSFPLKEPPVFRLTFDACRVISLSSV